MSKLLDLGGEIYPALTAHSPEDKLIPDYKALTGIIKAMAELPQNNVPDSQEKEETVAE